MLRTVDLFCGCGGMSLGFMNAGFDVIAGFDSWLQAVNVYRDNFAHDAVACDLGAASAAELVASYRPSLIVGGPPCQDFSSAGPGAVRSKRASLLQKYVDILIAVRPAFFVLENVPRTRLQPMFKRCEKRLRDAGYGLNLEVLNASRCGVPQDRRRLFLIGALGETDGFLTDHITRRLSARPLSMREHFGEALEIDYYFRVPTNYRRRGVFSVDEPCATIRAIDRPIPKGYPGHPLDPVPVGPSVRALTIEERSLVQTFPAGFRFTGTKTDLNTMIGNAVPVRMAQFVAEAIKQFAVERGAIRTNGKLASSHC